jgi:hypothetical protein
MPTTVTDPRRLLIGVLALCALGIAVFVGPGRAEANTKCPNAFRVLHNDHVGRLSLRAGSYRITVIDQNELSCQRASDLFAKFLQDFDGKLPNGWKVKVKQSGFVKSPQKGFFVKRTSSAGSSGGGGGRHPAKGEKICPGTFQVQHNDRIGDLHLRKGPYKITVIKKRRISCQKASSLFTKFLAKPSGLPKGWKLRVQSATFLKKGKHFGFRVKHV